MPKDQKKKPSHRPLKYGEPTVLVPIRVPVSKKQEIKKLVADYLKQFIVK